jgi:hypothetical protein
LTGRRRAGRVPPPLGQPHIGQPPVATDISWPPSKTMSLFRRCGSVAKGMKKISYRGYRFPPETIQQATGCIFGSL